MGSRKRSGLLSNCIDISMTLPYKRPGCPAGKERLKVIAAFVNNINRIGRNCKQVYFLLYLEDFFSERIILKNIVTILGSNWIPEFFFNSSIASSSLSDLRYGLSEIIAW